MGGDTADDQQDRDSKRESDPGPDTYQVAVETGITVTAARTASRDIRRHKASNYSPAASSPG